MIKELIISISIIKAFVEEFKLSILYGFIVLSVIFYVYRFVNIMMIAAINECKDDCSFTKSAFNSLIDPGFILPLLMIGLLFTLVLYVLRSIRNAYWL